MSIVKIFDVHVFDYITRMQGMRKMIDTILWIFLLPGDMMIRWLGVTSDQTQELARMLANSLFWIFVAVIGLWFWTSGFAIYQ